MTAYEYMQNVYRALEIYSSRNGPIYKLQNGIQWVSDAEHINIYAGREGCLRLAREFGYGLKDFSKEEREEVVKESYGYLCVKAYNMRPPVDAKEWIQEIMKMWEE